MSIQQELQTGQSMSCLEMSYPFLESHPLQLKSFALY